MEGKSLSKKAIVAIVIIAILVVAAISMVVVFLKDQGETEATAIGENNSNSEQTQDAVPENNGDNNDQGTATQSEEPQQEEQSEEQTTVANNDGATTNSGTTATTPTAPVQQTTTTTDGSTQVATTTTTETIPTQALTLAWSNMTVYGGELLANLDADVTDVTAPVRLATNILKDGESNDLREYYVKRGDTIYMYIAVNEELAHNPTFTLINNGTEYVMEDSLVTVRQSAENRWDYSVRYLIPEDTTFVDGEITLRVSNIEDVAGNSIPDENGPTNGHRVFYDGTAPEIHVKGTEGYMEEKENYVGNNEQDVYSKVSFKLSDNFKVVEYEVNDTLITGMTPSAWSDANFANIREFLVQGTNTITVRDIAGNESTYTFTYDSIAPVYSKLGILNKTRYVNKVEDLTWAKEGDEVRILISFPEKLAVEPTVKVFGKEYTATYRPASSNPEQNIYYYMVDFTLDETMPEGEIPFEVYGYADIAGNVGEKLEQTKINRDEYSKVIYDRTAPYSGNKDAGHPLYILNVSDANRRTWIKDGETLRVEANFNEDMDMSKAPILTIGTGKNVQTANFEYRSTVDGKRTFVADIVIDNNILGLADGTEVPFTVTNAFDLAGNEAILDNEDVTFTSEYGQVTYDNNAPVVKTVGMLNDTHYNEGKDTTVATTGDRIRLRVAFEEKLAVEPTVEVIGEDGTVTEVSCTYREQTSKPENNYYMYMADFTLTDEMNLPEGPIQVRISGYADAAGNVGEVVTEINEEAYPGVVYDTVAPELAAMGIFNWTNDNYGGDITLATRDEHIRLYVTFTEMLGVNPKVDIYGENGKVTTMDLAWSEAAQFYFVEFDTTDELQLPQGKIQFRIYGYEDVAGNVGKDITQEQTTSKEYPYVVFDTVAPEYTALGIVNGSHYDAKEGDIYHAKTGDYVRILVQFDNEKLAVMPKIRVLGADNKVVKEVNMIDAYLTSESMNTNAYSGQFTITEDMNLVEGEKIPVTVKGLVDLAGNTGDEVTTTGNDNYYVIFDRTAPKTLANNILKLGESNEQREYYVRPGDSIYMCYTANEELGHNPTFTLINNGKEYVMEDSQVIVKQNPAKAWDYTVIYEIPEDTTFVDGEIELKVSNIEDKAGNKREDVKGPTNGHKVFFDTTAPEKLNLGIARNIDNGDTRDQRYAKAGDSIRVLVSFPEKLAVEPKVEMFGKVYDVTYRPDSSIEESNIYYYMADVKIDQNTPEGEVAFKVYGYKDVAGNEGEPLTNADINDGKYTNVIIDNTKPTIEPTEDSISGSEGNYSRIGFKVTDDNGVASYEINGETLILTNGEISYEALKSYLKEGVNTVVASDEAGNTAEYTFNYDAVAPTREYSNIMVNGDDSTKHEFYAKIGDKLWVSIGVKEELAHNPSFTLINNGVEYPMDGNLVKANYDEKNDRYSYVLIYEIPEDTAFVDGEITFKISDLVDLFGNKMTDETKPSNGNRVFFDKTPATIKLNGTEEPITIEAGSEYVDAGATVTDNIDGFISSNYQFTYANYYADPNSDKVTESRLTEIDTRKTGLYKIAYIYTDKAGNTKQATRYLYIKDTTMPTVTLNGEENITIEAGTPYKDEGAKVTDNSDPTIENFKYTNINYYVNGELKKSHLTEVDVKQPGEYKIGYEYTDKSGNTKITVRTVIVKDTTAPVITANGKSQTLKVGDTYTELGATLTDNAYIDADDYEITIHFYDENGKLVYPSPSKVDTSKVGEYRIAYTAKDSSGNASNVATISVKVER